MVDAVLLIGGILFLGFGLGIVFPYFANKEANIKVAKWKFEKDQKEQRKTLREQRRNAKDQKENKKTETKIEPKEPFKCPKCGKYELRFVPDKGWYCSNCNYEKDNFFAGVNKCELS